MVQHRFIVISFPAQGHINPALQLAKLLVRTTGAHVTFVTAVTAHRRIGSVSTALSGLTFAPFSDGNDDGTTSKPDEDDVLHAFNQFKGRSSQAIVDAVESGIEEGRPYTCIVYTLLLTWVAEVATELHLQSALAWIQPATVFDIFYYYFNYKHLFKNNTGADINDDPSFAIELPGLPILLKSRDLPSFFLDSDDPDKPILKLFEDQFKKLGELSKPIILVNTFDALEPEALKAIDKYNLIAIGPLIPSAFLDDNDSSDKSFGGDLIQNSNDSAYIEWLNTKPERSVVYVSFGSISVLSKNQTDEIAKGLLESGRPFLWVIRENEKKGEGDKEEKEEEKLSCREELEELGKIVPWCNQVEVISNPSLGCFVTHCGWNSSLESLASGVPVVACPQRVDQCTNAKLVEDKWKTGVRAAKNEEGVVEGKELRRCLDLVMESEEMRRSAKKWKDLAIEAVIEGGSSDKNLNAFLKEIEEGLC